MLRRPSRTRFASHESTLEAFLRSRPVLQDVVALAEFTETLFDCRTQAERNARTESFVNLIESGEFLRKVRDVHNIMYHGRVYLRKFDGDESRIYSVFRETMRFQEALESIPVTPFVTAERKKEVVDLFMDRMTGPLVGQGGRIRINLLQDIHFTAMLLDPSQSPENDAPFQSRLY